MSSTPPISGPRESLTDHAVEERFRCLADALSVPVAFIDQERRFVRHNAAWREWVGDAPLVGRTLSEVLGPDTYERVRPQVDEALRGRRTHLETWVGSPPVGPRYIEVTCVPAGTPGEEIPGFLALATDITPRKHREDSEKLLRQADELLSTSPDEPSVLRAFVGLLVPGLGDGCAIDLWASPGAERRLIVRRAQREDPQILEGEISWRGPDRGEGVPEVYATGISKLLPEVTEEMVARSPSLRILLDRLDLRPPLSALLVPLAARGRTLGVVSLFSRRAGRTYSAEDLWLAEDLGRQAAGALEAARFHAEWTFETSHRRRTEEDLRESRDRLRLESEVAELATWDWEVRTGVLTLNDRFRALWALPASEGSDYRLLLGCIHPEDREPVQRAFRDQLKPNGGACRAEFRVVGRTDGVERWVFCQGRVVHDSSGQPIRVVGMAIDISERKRVERELLFRKTLLESQTEAAIDGILVVDPVGRMISFNHRFVEMWGIPPEVIASRSDEAALSSVLPQLSDPEGFLSRVRYLYGHPNEESQDELSLKDGRTFDRYSAPVRDAAGGYYGRVWNFRDVTEKHHQDEELRQSASRLQTALDELNTFAYTVAHDLRAPLRAMAGFSHLLELEYSPGLDLEAQDYVRRIAEAAQRMDKLIQDLLAYSRVSRVSMKIETVDLGSLVSDILGRFQSEFQERQARVDVAEPLPCVLAYRVALDQVLANLISNAVKFVAPGTRPEIRIHGERIGEVVRLSVLDNGIGISPDQQDRIFGVFERLHPTEYPGTGIGLASVKRAMERMGGRVGVENRPEGGSRFWIDLRAPSAAASD